MHEGRYLFAQLMDHLPTHLFRAAVRRYDGDRFVKSFSCMDQFRSMAFAQLSGRESLRDIEICLRAHQSKLYHLGIRGRVSRSTLADANERRDARIYADFARDLIAIARELYRDDPLTVELEQAVYAIDSTTIDVCVSLFPWARAMHAGCGALKLHTTLDVKTAIPTDIQLSDGRLHDVNMLDRLVPEPGAIYLMDRGYMDFGRLHRLHTEGAFFLMRAKRNTRVKRRCSHPVEDRTTVICDQTVVLARPTVLAKYPAPLRRIRIRDDRDGSPLVLITNLFAPSAETIGALYRRRWRIEIFFKWIKQHLRIKAFFGTSTNAVMTQVWIAICVYVLMAIVRKRLGTEASLYSLLQVFSVTLFDKTPMNSVFGDEKLHESEDGIAKQLILFAD
jgi:hypothetical protein